MRNIIVAIDIPVTEQKIIQSGTDLARSYNSKLWLIHATPPNPDFVGYRAGPQSVRDNIAKSFHEEHKALQNEAHMVREQGIDATALLIQGPAGETILKESILIKADMIIIGACNHSSIHKAILGSVSDYILRHSHIPVLVVPAHDKATD